MATKEKKTLFTLELTEEQREAIEICFDLNYWDLSVVEEKGINNSEDDCDERNCISVTDANETNSGDENSHESHPDMNIDGLCEYCFCCPCVTVNRHSWLGNGPNSKTRKQSN